MIDGNAPKVNLLQNGHSRSPNQTSVTGACGRPKTLAVCGMPERRAFTSCSVEGADAVGAACSVIPEARSDRGDPVAPLRLATQMVIADAAIAATIPSCVDRPLKALRMGA